LYTVISYVLEHLFHCTLANTPLVLSSFVIMLLSNYVSNKVNFTAQVQCTGLQLQ